MACQSSTANLELLRSENSSGTCAKLHTTAASNNVHMPFSLYCRLFALHICGAVLRAHSVRGEPRIQRNTSGEVDEVSVYCVTSSLPHAKR